MAFGTELTLMITSAVVAVSGIFLAYFFYMLQPSIPQNLARSTRPLFALLAHKYWIDELYDTLIVQPGLKLSRAFADGLDKVVIDETFIDGTARLFGRFGGMLSKLQNGYTGSYALATFIGVIIMISYFFLR